MAYASPTKLRDGTWGARAAGSVAAGDRITIRTRSGQTWEATVTRILWRGEGATICATSQSPKRSRRNSVICAAQGCAAHAIVAGGYCEDCDRDDI